MRWIDASEDIMDTPKDTTPAVETAKKLDLLAAQGLSAAKRGLEASARWLDGRAKLVGELADKLAHRA